jgi:hypothetical protein
MGIDISEAKVERNEFGLWLGWTLATTAGMLAGFLPILLLTPYIELGLVRILLPLWAGLLVGIFQWLALRPYLTHSADWIIYGGAGWALGFALGLLLIQLLGGTTIGALISYILFGLIVALIQWPVLRREIPNVGYWVAASVVGWALGAILSQVVLNLIVTGDSTSQVLSTAVISAVTGLVAGAITGIALIWEIRQPEAA